MVDLTEDQVSEILAQGQRNTVNAPYDQIIGIDFGHGEVSAHCVKGKETFQLKLDTRSGDRTMITVIAYGKKEEILIGANAKARPDAIPYFKASPSVWDEEAGGKPKKILMRDFFKQLIAQIKEANKDDITVTPNNTLLYVGCPSSKTWTGENVRRQYEELVREATGIADVRVVPESRAAIFSAFVQAKGLKINANDGIAVFDFGSSTADFTYIQLDACEEECSWTLGASMIEQMIVQNEIAKLDAEVDFRDSMRQALEMRGYKERIFDAFAVGSDWYQPVTLAFTKCENGRPKYLLKNGKGSYDKNGRPVYERVTSTFEPNEDYMNECLKQDLPIPVYEDDRPIYEDEERRKIGSWRTLCYLFFNTMKKRLDAKNLPCRLVVLTGGASRMKFVEDACRDVFRDSTISVESNPSCSVSIGLCYLAEGQEHMQGAMDKYRPSLRQDLEKGLEEMLGDFSDKAVSVIYDETIRILSDIEKEQGEHKVSEVTVELKKRVDDDMESISQKLQEQTDGVMKDWQMKFSEQLNGYASTVVAECYPGLNGQAVMSLKQEYVENFTEGFTDAFKSYIQNPEVYQELMIHLNLFEEAISRITAVLGFTGVRQWLVDLVEFSQADIEKLKNDGKKWEKMKEKIYLAVKKILESKDVIGEGFAQFLDAAVEEGDQLAGIVALQNFDSN